MPSDGFGLVSELEGFEGAIQEYAEETVRQAAAEGLEGAVKKDILSKAVYYTPVDTGSLQNSATAVQLGDLEWQIVYPLDYAIYVHERVELSHDGHEQAKFLERAFQWVRTFGGIEYFAGKRMQRRLG